MAEAGPKDTYNDGRDSTWNLESLEVPELSAEILWSDPREKRNPNNWNKASKLFHTIVPGLLAFEM